MVSAVQTLKDKYLKDPDFIPPKGKSKEEVVEELVTQKIKQARNNSRAFELMNKEMESADGYAWDKEDPQKTWEDKKGPKFEIAKETPDQYGDPSISHLRIMHRPLKVLPGSADDYKVDDPPELDSDEIKTGLKHIKRAKGFLEARPELDDDISEQDDDVLHPFLKYAEENDLKVDEQYLGNLMADVSTITMYLKYKHNMPRPWQYDGTDEPKDTETATPSYPSGHSAQAKVAAEVLAGSYPEHKQQFEDIGGGVGLNRIMAGWHFPVDHSSGRDLADQILEKLPKNADMFLKKSGLIEDDYMAAIKSVMEKHADDFNIPTNMFKSLLSKGREEIEDVAQALKDEGIFSTPGNARQWLKDTGVKMESSVDEVNEIANNWRSYHQSLEGSDRKPIKMGRTDKNLHLPAYEAHIKPEDAPAASTAPTAALTAPADTASTAAPVDTEDKRTPEQRAIDRRAKSGIDEGEYQQARREKEALLRERGRDVKSTPPEERASQRDVEEAKKQGVAFDTDLKGTVTIADTEDNRVTVSGIFSRNLDNDARGVRTRALPTKAELIDAGMLEDDESYRKEINRRQEAYSVYVKHKDPIRSPEDSDGAKFVDSDGNEASRSMYDAKKATYVKGSGKGSEQAAAREKIKAYAGASEAEQGELYQGAVKDVPDIIHVNSSYHNALDIDPDWKIDTPSVDPDISNLDPADTLWDRLGVEGFRPEAVAAQRAGAPTPDPERVAQVTEGFRTEPTTHQTRGEAFRLRAQLGFFGKDGKVKAPDIPTSMPTSQYDALIILQNKRLEPGFKSNSFASKADHFAAVLALLKGEDVGKLAVGSETSKALKKAGVDDYGGKYGDRSKSKQIPDGELGTGSDKVDAADNIDLNASDIASQEAHNQSPSTSTEPNIGKAKADIKSGDRTQEQPEEPETASDISTEEQERQAEGVDTPVRSEQDDPAAKFEDADGNEVSRDTEGALYVEGSGQEGETPSEEDVKQQQEAAGAEGRKETEQEQQELTTQEQKAADAKALKSKVAAQGRKLKGAGVVDHSAHGEYLVRGALDAYKEKYKNDKGVDFDPKKKGVLRGLGKSIIDYYKHDAMGEQVLQREHLGDHLENIIDSIADDNFTPVPPDGHITDTPKDPDTSEETGAATKKPTRKKSASKKPTGTESSETQPETAAEKPDTTEEPAEAAEFDTSKLSRRQKKLWDTLDPSDAVHIETDGTPRPMTSVTMDEGRQAFVRNENGSWSPITGVKNVLSDEKGVPHLRTFKTPFETDGTKKIEDLQPTPDETPYKREAAFSDPQRGAFYDVGKVLQEIGFGSESKALPDANAVNASLDTGVRTTLDDERIGTAVNSHIISKIDALDEDSKIEGEDRVTEDINSNALHEFSHEGELSEDTTVMGSEGHRILQGHLDRIGLGKLKDMSDDALITAAAAPIKTTPTTLVDPTTPVDPTAGPTVTPQRTEAEKIRERAKQERAEQERTETSGSGDKGGKKPSDLTNGEVPDFDKFFGEHESDFQDIYDHRYQKTGKDKHHSFDDFKESRRQKFDKNRATFTDSFSDEVFKVNNEKTETAAEDESNKAAQGERRAKAQKLKDDVYGTPKKQQQMDELFEHIAEQEKNNKPEGSRRFHSKKGAAEWYWQNGDHPNIDAWNADAEKAHKEIQAKKAKGESSQGKTASTAETAAKKERNEKARDALNDLKNVSRDGSEGIHAIEEKLIAATKLSKEHKQAFAEDRQLSRQYRKKVQTMAEVAGRSKAGGAAVENLKDEHKKHGDEGFLGDDHTQARTDAHNKAKEAHDKHDEHTNAVNKQGFDHASFSHEDAKDNQKLRSHDEKGHKADLKAGATDGKTDVEIAQDRIRRGLPPGAPPRPGLEWHKETHRWVNPDIYKDVGKMLNAGESVHIADPESMGLAHHEGTTPGGGVLVDDKGNMYNASAAHTNKYGLKSLDHGDLAHSPTEAQHQRSVAANHMVVNGKHSMDQQELERRLNINHVVTGLDEFAKRRKKGALASFLKPIAAGAAVGALGGPGFAVVGGAIGGALAFKGLNRLRQYSKHKVADKIKQDMPNMTRAEHDVLDAYTGKKSNLKSGVGTALKYGLVGSVSPVAAGLMASPAAGRLGMRAARAMGRSVRGAASSAGGVENLRNFVSSETKEE